jgi:hypothetical protein
MEFRKVGAVISYLFFGTEMPPRTRWGDEYRKGLIRAALEEGRQGTIRLPDSTSCTAWSQAERNNTSAERAPSQFFAPPK